MKRPVQRATSPTDPVHQWAQARVGTVSRYPMYWQKVHLLPDVPVDLLVFISAVNGTAVGVYLRDAPTKGLFLAGQDDP